VERARSIKRIDVIDVLHTQRFDTVLGSIGWNEKGDLVSVPEWGWWLWRNDTDREISTPDLLEGRLVEKPGQ
jgi:hypothetical protein